MLQVSMLCLERHLMSADDVDLTPKKTTPTVQTPVSSTVEVSSTLSSPVSSTVPTPPGDEIKENQTMNTSDDLPVF